MKYLISVALCLFVLLPISTVAQENYVVNGETYTLKSDVKGDLELLWNIIDGQYRYFSKIDGRIVELINTKQDGKFQEEYKEVLREQTKDVDISTKNVNLTLSSLHKFFVEYNQKKNSAFVDNKKPLNLKSRLGIFAGVDNAIFTANPENALHPVAGVDFEIVDPVKLKRHSMVLRFKQTFKSSDHNYSASQFSLNYRFKFIKTPRLDVYANAKFAAMNFSTVEIVTVEETNPVIVRSRMESSSNFNSPLTFGIGADYKMGNGYITLGYHDIVGLNVDSNQEFPLNLTLGYKFEL